VLIGEALFLEWFGKVAETGFPVVEFW